MSCTFLGQTLYNLHKRNQSKCKFLRLWSAWVKIHEILVIFWNNKSVFLQMLHHSLVSWEIAHLYLFSWNFIYFQQKELIKVQTWRNFTWTVKSLKFYTLKGSFCPNDIKAPLKKNRRVISHDTEEWYKV